MKKNKKSAMTAEMVIAIAILMTSFFVTTAVITEFAAKAKGKTVEEICRGSIAAQQQIRINPPGPEFLTGDFTPVPLLCQTIPKDTFPEDENADKEQVKKEVADLAARCWYMFYEGYIDDVFEQGEAKRNNCFICYTLTTRETPNFQETISEEELLNYLIETPKKVQPKSDFCRNFGGWCVDNPQECFNHENKNDIKTDANNNICKKKQKNTCCYSKFTCINNGGICKTSDFQDEKYKRYDGWKCPAGTVCFVEAQQYYSYVDYIQFGGGKGNLLITTPIKPKEIYAISFGSPTDKCDWCSETGAWLGIGVGVVVTGYVIVQTGGIAAIPLLAKVAIAGTTGTVIGTAAGFGAKEVLRMPYAWWFERDVSTIYITTLDQVMNEDLCTYVEPIEEKEV